CQIVRKIENRRMRNRTYGGVRGRKTKVGRKLSFSSYSINLLKMIMKTLFWVIVKSTYKYLFFV
ncbi:hypothetical protein, partial [Bacteroides stercoris]|uniref:hypothetical protein n=1 Tax=Bacteroides stercoris TaxID=46506 RepID=UPI001CEF6CB7